MTSSSKHSSSTRARAKAARKTHTKEVKRAATVKQLSQQGGKKRAGLEHRARKEGVIQRDSGELNRGAVQKWTH